MEDPYNLHYRLQSVPRITPNRCIHHGLLQVSLLIYMPHHALKHHPHKCPETIRKTLSRSKGLCNILPIYKSNLTDNAIYNMIKLTQDQHTDIYTSTSKRDRKNTLLIGKNSNFKPRVIRSPKPG